jgi:hypothetical protein
MAKSTEKRFRQKKERAARESTAREGRARSTREGNARRGEIGKIAGMSGDLLFLWRPKIWTKIFTAEFSARFGFHLDSEFSAWPTMFAGYLSQVPNRTANPVSKRLKLLAALVRLGE